MSVRLNAVTGATGLLGSHIAEQLVERGEKVRALVRPSSDTSFLKSLGVELFEGDLTDASCLHRFVGGADVVYHSAAKVGDWGKWREFQTEIIDATANLLDAAKHEAIGRFLHVSSIIVYGHPRPHADKFTEDEPLGQNIGLWEYYCRSKIAAESLFKHYPGAWTIVRPAWIYGPRDRRTLSRLFKALNAGRVKLLGNGDNYLNMVYASDAADAVIRAATTPQAVGQAYNVSSEGEITQREMLNLFTDEMKLPRITRRFPMWLAFAGGFFSEMIGKMIFLKRPPHITRYVVRLIARSTNYSIEKAKRELGWQRRVPPAEGLRRSLEWYNSTQFAR